MAFSMFPNMASQSLSGSLRKTPGPPKDGFTSHQERRKTALKSGFGALLAATLAHREASGSLF